LNEFKNLQLLSIFVKELGGRYLFE